MSWSVSIMSHEAGVKHFSWNYYDANLPTVAMFWNVFFGPCAWPAVSSSIHLWTGDGFEQKELWTSLVLFWVVRFNYRFVYSCLPRICSLVLCIVIALFVWVVYCKNLSRLRSQAVGSPGALAFTKLSEWSRFELGDGKLVFWCFLLVSPNVAHHPRTSV